MERNQLEVLARIVPPSEILLDHFEIIGVEQSSTGIRIHLDELTNTGVICIVTMVCACSRHSCLY